MTLPATLYSTLTCLQQLHHEPPVPRARRLRRPSLSQPLLAAPRPRATSILSILRIRHMAIHTLLDIPILRWRPYSHGWLRGPHAMA